MSDRANIKVSREAYERHNEQRKQMGLTWEEYLDGQSPNIEDVIRQAIRDELDKE
jgi:hypothetical protein